MVPIREIRFKGATDTRIIFTDDQAPVYRSEGHEMPCTVEIEGHKIVIRCNVCGRARTALLSRDAELFEDGQRVGGAREVRKRLRYRMGLQWPGKILVARNDDVFCGNCGRHIGTAYDDPR